MRTDTERLDALAELSGVGLIHNDMKHWAVSGDGFQNLPGENFDEPFDCQTAFMIEKEKWKPTIREAIDAYLDERTEIQE
jgi:hypothetical protein